MIKWDLFYVLEQLFFCLYGVKIFTLLIFYAIFILKLKLFSFECRRSPESFTKHDLPADFSTVVSLNPNKFALEEICCKLLQTFVDKNIKLRRLIHDEHDQLSYTPCPFHLNNF